MSNDGGWKTSQSIADFMADRAQHRVTPLKLRESLAHLSGDLDPADRRDRLGKFTAM